MSKGKGKQLRASPERPVTTPDGPQAKVDKVSRKAKPIHGSQDDESDVSQWSWRRRWNRARKGTKALIALIVGLAALIGALQLIGGTATKVIRGATAPSKAEADASTINSLRAGSLSLSFHAP
jgi:hypothetical protein